MQNQKYSVNQHPVETILTWIKSGEIAIPEIQRPFVWDSTKVRDLMDSLYQGFPIGYIIAWKNPNIRLKDGKTSEGRKVLIDGQQRLTALTAAILGKSVITKEYKSVKIVIAFHPLLERFEVFNTAIKRDNAWIKDISTVVSSDSNIFEIVEKYCDVNMDVDRKLIFNRLEGLRKILQRPIGIIELYADLDIETVTEIFIRINSKGVVLSQADFAMSKIASNETYGGSLLRKCIDYFSHLSIAPEFYTHISENDNEFKLSEYFSKVSWLKNEKDDLYDPDYNDVLRVAFTSEFKRGKISDLVSLLSGRNFEKKVFEEEVAEESFNNLKKGVLNFINESNFKRFVMIIKSAGFIDASLISSQNALNFAYIVYLTLKSQHIHDSEIESHVKRWLVFSLLTSRFSGSPESTFDLDIRSIADGNHDNYLTQLEAANLSDAFWDVGLMQELNTSSVNSPSFNVYLAALSKMNTKGFLSKDISVKELIEHKGDIHHLFPKDYLRKNGLTKGKYNQVANFVYMQTEINIKVGNKSPKIYFGELVEQCKNGNKKYGGITDIEILKTNLVENDIPLSIFELEIEDYEKFLEERRFLMSQKLKKYYQSL